MVIDKLERRFGRFAIPNLTVLLIIGQSIAWAAEWGNPGTVDRIRLVPQLVLNGEVYRLILFLFVPPPLSPLWFLLSMYVFHLMGTALENSWGAFRYNVYLLTGYLATVIVGFLLFPLSSVTNSYVNLTVFFAFATLYPTFEFLILFILPIQVRWLAIPPWIFLALAFFESGWAGKVQVAASVLNYFLFFGVDIFRRIRTGQRSMRQRAARTAAQRKASDYFHICATCGITDQSDPEMDFRYCSQCSGNLAYCSQHLKDHEHVRDPE